MPSTETLTLAAETLALHTLAAEALWLVSPWKPVVMLAGLVAWARVISSIYDKDANRFHLNPKRWNLIHIGFGAGALAVGMLAPSFWIGLPAMAGLLALNLGVYYTARNRNPLVPRGQKWSLKGRGAAAAAKAKDEGPKQTKLNKALSLRLYGPDGEITPPGKKDARALEVRLAAETLLLDALDRRAARLLIDPVETETYAQRRMVDGVVTPGETLPKNRAVPAIDFLKAVAGLDVQDRRRKQAGTIKIQRGAQTINAAIKASGASAGVRIEIIFSPLEQVSFTAETLGLLPKQKEVLESLYADPAGVVLVATMPRQGKTSTLYAMLGKHDAYTSNIQTVEIDQAMTIEGARHNIFDPKDDDADYPTLLRSVYRRDPDIVMVAEMNDEATAAEIADADSTRTRSIVGVRAESAAQAVAVYVRAVGNKEKAAKSLRGVVSQRLVRKLCENCRVAQKPTPEMLKKLGVPAEKAPETLYRKGGRVLIRNKPSECPVCNGTGYYGAEGVFEIFPIDHEQQERIAAGDMRGLKASWRAKHLPSIQDAAIAKALRGVTSIEEIVRALTPSKPRKTRTETAKQTAD